MRYIPLFLLLPLAVFSQVTQDKIVSARNYLNNRITWRILEYKAYPDAKDTAAFYRVQKALKTASVEQAKSYMEMEGILNQNYTKVLQKFSRLLESDKTDVSGHVNPHEIAQALTTSAFRILSINYKDVVEHFPGYSDTLTSELTTFFGGTAQIQSPPAGTEGQSGQPEDTTDNKPLESTDKFSSDNKWGFFTGFNAWVLLSYLLIFIFLSFFIAKTERLKKSNAKRKQEIDELRDYLSQMQTGWRSGSTGQNDASQTASLLELLKQLKVQLLKQETSIEDLQRQLSLIIGSNPLPIPSAETGNTIVFYMTMPTESEFKAKSKSGNPANTVYKFTLLPSGNEADYEVHTQGASVQEIVMRRQSYLKPACDEINNPPSNCKAIKTLRKGQAKLHNENWVIISKALIRYE